MVNCSVYLDKRLSVEYHQGTTYYKEYTMKHVSFAFACFNYYFMQKK